MAILAGDLAGKLYAVVKNPNSGEIVEQINLNNTKIGTETTSKNLVVTGNVKIGGQLHGSIMGVPSNAGGRLTLTAGTPITTSDVSSATTIYYSPFSSGQIILWTGTEWKLFYFDEISLIPTLAASKNYDVFVYASGDRVFLEIGRAWTDDNTRSESLAYFQGVRCLNRDYTRRYVGTIRSTSSSLLEDSVSNRTVWNYDNRVIRTLRRIETASSWSYSGIAYRVANNNTANSFTFVAGDTTHVYARVYENVTSATGGFGATVGIGVDSTTTNSAGAYGGITNTNLYSTTEAEYSGYPSIGFHTFYWLEISGGVSTTWYGNIGNTGFFQFGITGHLLG